MTSRDYQRNLNQHEELYNFVLEKCEIFAEDMLVMSERHYFPKLFLCQQINGEESEMEIPGAIIIGGVEILGGSLIYVLPFPGAKQLGAIMVGDGIRRAFNGLEEIDKQGNKLQND